MAAWANALGAGALGKLIGNLSDWKGSGAWARHAKQDEDIEQQKRAFLGRVEWARMAGLHPLVAMGSGGYGGGSGGYGDGSPVVPYDIGDRKDPNLDRYNAARADLAELQVAEARRALAAQAGNQGGGIPFRPELSQTDQFVVKPGEVTSVARGIPYLQATPPAATEQRFAVMGPFGEVQYGNLPSSDVGEKIENMGEIWQAILMSPLAMRFMYDTWVPSGLKRDFRTLKRGIERFVGDPGESGGFSGRSNSPW